MKLSAANVTKTFASCLASKNDIAGDMTSDGTIMVTGALPNLSAVFKKESLKKHEADIVSMLDSLPQEFKESCGGGWSFLNACIDKDGNQWGEQSTVNQLLMLGLATGKARYTLPREMWSMLPGGVPYFVVDDVGEQEKEA